MADLSKLSDADLMALKSGDLTKLSDDGLYQIRGGAAGAAKAANARQALIAQRGATPEQLASADPTKDMGFLDKTVAGYGGAVPKMIQGTRQLLNIGDQGQLLQEIQDTKKRDAPLLKTGGGFVGNLLGNMAPAGVTMAIPGANTVAGGALIGIGQGAITPTASGTTDEAVREAVLGGIGGGGGVLAGRALPIAGKSLFAPFTEGGRREIAGRALNQVAGPGAIAAALKAPQLVKGSVPSLAEATGDVGIAGLELAAKSASPEVKRRLVEQGMNNNAARIEALRSIAGTPQDRSMAEGLRSFMAGPLYKEAAQEGISKAAAQEAAPLVQNLTERMPKGIIEKAKELARLNGETFSDEGSVRGLHYVKKSVDDLIGKAKRDGATEELRALTQFKGDLLSTAETLSPKYAKANKEFAFWSQPVNQREIGQKLLDKVEPALSRFDEGLPTAMNANAYAKAVLDAPGTIKSATGMGFDSLEKIMTPAQMDIINGVGKDLARKARAESLAKTTGSTTAQNLSGQNLLANVIGPLGMPQSWAQSVAASSLGQTLSKPVGMLYKGAEPAVQGLLGEALANPQFGALLMQEVAKKSPKTAQKIYEGLLPYAGSGLLTSQQQ